MSGILYTADFSMCKPEELHYNRIAVYFMNALETAKATPINGSGAKHIFPNGGMSATVLLRESHAAIHTWPETRFVTFELFCCGETVSALSAIHYLADILQCEDFKTNRYERFPKNETTAKPVEI